MNYPNNILEDKFIDFIVYLYTTNHPSIETELLQKLVVDKYNAISNIRHEIITLSKSATPLNINAVISK